MLRFMWVWWWEIVGLPTPRLCKTLQLPRLKSEEPRDSNGDISGFLHRGSCTVGPGVTLHLVWQMESRTWQQSFLLRGEGGYHS